MIVAIPPEFESYAREQVKAGLVASEEEAVALALRDYLTFVRELKAAVDKGFAALDRGEGVDGSTFMQDLLAETKALARAE